MTRWPNHAEAWRAWRDALAGERMHHGWLLAGKSGLGKRDFAQAAARELVAEPGVPQPAGEHPDIITLTYGPKDDKGEKAQAEGKPYERARSIRIRQIRAMQRRLVPRPTLGRRRAIIIDPADDLEKAAANALLKSLEEPPAGTFFLLVTHRPARLLPTIRSRCRNVNLRVPSRESVTELLIRRDGLVDVPQAVRAQLLLATAHTAQRRQHHRSGGDEPRRGLNGEVRAAGGVRPAGEHRGEVAPGLAVATSGPDASLLPAVAVRPQPVAPWSVGHQPAGLGLRRRPSGLGSRRRSLHAPQRERELDDLTHEVCREVVEVVERPHGCEVRATQVNLLLHGVG
jgi:hypothetical protein